LPFAGLLQGKKFPVEIIYSIKKNTVFTMRGHSYISILRLPFLAYLLKTCACG